MVLSGFGNHHQTEAIPGALPPYQNSPQHCPMGLYAEQLSGSAFTRPRAVNWHSWLYRQHPSAQASRFQPYAKTGMSPWHPQQPPEPMRWSALPSTEQQHDFIDGLFLLAGNTWCRTYLYQCQKNMQQRFFTNRDGEMLIVPYQGGLQLHTEMGLLDIQPGQIAVIPRGVVFRVTLNEKNAAGYLCENLGLPFTLPALGPLGANSLAHPRHFIYPSARVEDDVDAMEMICKYQHHWWMTPLQHTPLDVVAWHGNYAPYCYDLALFNTVNSVSFDHPDPSIFTVLTSESDTPGIANLDLVIFPSRWMVAEHTFRPPYFHRNSMSELMGLIQGEYDAKQEGFSVGAVSIHNTMTPHGPDYLTYQKATQQSLQPEYYANTLAFMFESKEPWLVSEQAFQHVARQLNYTDCWKGL